MSCHHESPSARHSLAARLKEVGEVDVADCYQCGKCTAGCPAAEEMDVAPSQILRLLQTESPKHEKRALESMSIWLCIGCETCVTRCPQEVDLPRAMDILRQESLARNVANRAADDIVAFHKAFLHSIERSGRVFEFGMIGDYKLRTGHLFQDLGAAPSMFLKGKMSLLPHGGGSKREVGRMFARARAAKKESQP
ncbi:MAG: 4Fe-4S dicluster domain-containing protein [Deltaproteobacteria bacterium]|nr:4Fe-4S dicluster domain-containing protein [Deltaproteobacteria bacterium]